MHGLFANLAGLALIDIRYTANERTLQIAEGVASYALDAEFVLDLVAEQIGEGAGSRELHVAVGIPFHVRRQLSDDRGALAVVDAFRRCNHAAAILVVSGLYVRQKFLDAEGTFRQVDQVRAIVGKLLPKRRRGGQKAGMPPHNHAQIHSRQRGIVQVGPHESLCDKSGCRREARRVIITDQVVIDRLWNVNAAQRIIGSPRFLADDPHRVGRIIAADVEEIPYVVSLENLEYLLAIFQVGLVAGRPERG